MLHCYTKNLCCKSTAYSFYTSVIFVYLAYIIKIAFFVKTDEMKLQNNTKCNILHFYYNYYEMVTKQLQRLFEHIAQK